LEQWGLRDAVLIRAADSLVETKGIDDQLWGQLRQYFDDAELVELTMLAAHYDMLATFITTLGIQPDTRPSR
jgi:alkylhydroperoxidase family enzyme